MQKYQLFTAYKNEDTKKAVELTTAFNMTFFYNENS